MACGYLLKSTYFTNLTQIFQSCYDFMFLVIVISSLNVTFI